MEFNELKELLAEKNVNYWQKWCSFVNTCTSVNDLLLSSKLRIKAENIELTPPLSFCNTTRIAFIGGYTFDPLYRGVVELLAAERCQTEIFIGDFDNYVYEIISTESALYDFNPDIVYFSPSEHRCHYDGLFTDNLESQKKSAIKQAEEINELCNIIHLRSGAEIILSNFKPMSHCDLGAYRVRTYASDWTYRKVVNLELGIHALAHTHICDVEFLSSCIGLIESSDAKNWFETRQPCSWLLMFEIMKEISHLILSLKKGPKKVLVLDLDNTLWGGVIGDDGIEGIALGDTSAVGEAYKSFQKYVKTLANRGVLLAVCSKNDIEVAKLPFENHPERVLVLKDFSSFKANWKSKADNIQEIAKELNLGLDSFVFVDDNPAEIEIVNQYASEVSTILLGPDVSDYISQIKSARFFEPISITEDDLNRTHQYKTENKRHELKSTITDMPTYLKSLEMKVAFSEFNDVDLTRIEQLINKSNQFNMTSIRRTQMEIRKLMAAPSCVGFSVRLKDKFGDNGLIAIVIGKIAHRGFIIDTFLMSCRVLERQVEDEMLREIVRLASIKGCHYIQGDYIPSKKNMMVRKLYEKLGFKKRLGQCDGDANENSISYEMKVEEYIYKKTNMDVMVRSYGN